MIKVKEIKTHRANDFPFGAQKDKLVTKGKLVCADVGNFAKLIDLEELRGKVRPIWVSETEKIVVGDLILVN